MITVSDVSVSFGGQLLFKDVDLKFTAGNCYGVIGANGAGKSTFLKVLCGDLEPTKGSVSKPAELRMSVLRQDHYAFDDYTVAVNFSDKAAVEKNKEFLMLNLNEVMVLPFEPDPFVVDKYEEMFVLYFTK